MKRMRSKEEIVGIVNEGIEKGEIEAGGTEVIANPTLAGTESALTGLQVGDTKYKVEGEGGHLHALFMSDAFMLYKNDSASDVTIAEIEEYLISNGHISRATLLPTAEYTVLVGGTEHRRPLGFYVDGNDIMLLSKKRTLSYTANLETGAVTVSGGYESDQVTIINGFALKQYLVY